MEMQNRYLTQLLLSASLAVAACGGGATPPAETPSGTSEKSAPAAKAGTEAKATPAPAPEAKPAPAPAADTGMAQRSGREPREILELKDNVFFFSFEESDVKQVAETACTKQSGNDPKKMAACMSKARNEYDGDGHRFVQDKSGDWWWSVIKRKGKTLSNVHKVRYQYGDQSGNTIVIKPEGRDEGSARWAKPPSEVKFEVPTEYRIVVQDPKQGKMVYEAKAIVAGE